MSSTAVRILAFASLIAAVAASSGWYQAHANLRELRANELNPIAAMLKEDQELLRTLQTDPYPDKHSAILTAYLAKIRADGVSEHAEMKQRLDRLAENNSAIVALLNVYSPHAKTAAFSAEGARFGRYAIAWRDRWNSVMELFMAGGNYPAAEVPFPREFVGTLEAEIEDAQHYF